MQRARVSYALNGQRFYQIDTIGPLTGSAFPMAVGTTPILTGENSRQLAAQIEKIVHSHIFFGSETSCKLLIFLAEHSFSAPLKEYEIATAVMGRRSDFDPRLDSSVRVQMARLRTKLAEYMATEGQHDPYIVEVPKGSYRLAITHNPNSNSRAAIADNSAQEHGQEVSTAPPSLGSLPGPVLLQSATGKLSPDSDSLSTSISPKALYIMLLVLVFVAATCLGFFLRNGMHTARRPALDEEVQAFWNPFLSDPQGPLTIFSNAPFEGNAINGLRYELPGQHAPSVHSFYTGIGEALGIHKLDAVFSQLGLPLRLRPGSLVSVEDVRDANLIFIGAPVENLMVNKVVTFRHFGFRELLSGPRTGQVVIENRNPLPGEPSEYMGVNPPEAAVVDDYALIARMPTDSTHISIAAAGTTTIGTEAAIEYICQPDTLRSLRQKIGPLGSDSEFEVILHISIVDDVPMKEEIVAVRRDRKQS